MRFSVRFFLMFLVFKELAEGVSLTWTSSNERIEYPKTILKNALLVSFYYDIIPIIITL